MNLLTDRLPDTVEIAGNTVRIQTSHRKHIQFELNFDAQEDEEIILMAQLMNMYSYRDEDGVLQLPEVVINNQVEAYKRAIEFHAYGLIDFDNEEDVTPIASSETPQKLHDWLVDDTVIVADFMREYHIDLTDPNTKMHWYTFKALFDGLSQDSFISKLGYYRGKPPKGMKGDALTHWKQIHEKLRIPLQDEEAEAQRQWSMLG